MTRCLVLVMVAILFAIPAAGLTKGLFTVGQEAPSFTLQSTTGESVTLADLRGKVVVLGLFHICKPCLIQGMMLQKVYVATRGKNVAVVGVNSSGDSAASVTGFLKHFPLHVTYPYLIDPRKITDKLYGGGRFIPNVYVIDQQGVIRWQRVGSFVTDGKLAGHEEVLEEVERLLQQGHGSE